MPLACTRSSQPSLSRSPAAPPQPKRCSLSAPRRVASSRSSARRPPVGIGHPEQAALRLQRHVDVGDVDVEPAVAVDVGQGGVHALVGVAADRPERRGPETRRKPAPRFVQVEVVGPEVVGHVQVGPAVAVEVAGADGQGPVRLRQAHGHGIEPLEAPVAQVAVEHVAPAVLGVVPARVHEVEHPAVARVLGLGQAEDAQSGAAAGSASRRGLMALATKRSSRPSRSKSRKLAARLTVCSSIPLARVTSSKSARPVSTSRLRSRRRLAVADGQEEVLVAVAVVVHEQRAGGQAVRSGSRLSAASAGSGTRSKRRPPRLR